jgi:hypothetical protein
VRWTIHHFYGPGNTETLGPLEMGMLYRRVTVCDCMNQKRHSKKNKRKDEEV